MICIKCKNNFLNASEYNYTSTLKIIHFWESLLYYLFTSRIINIKHSENNLKNKSKTGAMNMAWKENTKINIFLI